MLFLNSAIDRGSQIIEAEGGWATDAEIAVADSTPGGRAVLFRGRHLDSPLGPLESIVIEE
jgi:hypothetical protein